MMIMLSLMLMLPFLVYSQNTTDPPQILIAQLIHYQSVDSPFYDPTKTIEDLADMALRSSISRAQYLTANGSLVEDIDSQLMPVQGGFLARLKIGSQEVEQFVFMDTGSHLLWVNCVPTLGDVETPYYNPHMSTSYEVETCDIDYTDVCVGPGSVVIQCGDDYSSEGDGCKFWVRYLGGKMIAGDLGRETFKFGWLKSKTLRGIVFGCSNSKIKLHDGVLGLGNLGISLISQYQTSKFSYCIGDLTNRSYGYNELVIGEKVELWGTETPLIIDSHYYINLEGIAIGKTSLAFDPKIFKRKEYSGGICIDTASTYSFIPQVVLTALEDAIKKTMQDRLTRFQGKFYKPTVPMLCYDGVVDRDLKWFPEVTLQFQDGAIMYLTPDNIFEQYSIGYFCLTILPAESLEYPINILGIYMQQHFYVAYDLSRMMISFSRTDCETIHDAYAHDEL